MATIQSVLLRFVSHTPGSPYQYFARFTGTCQDQSINCCIALTCDSEQAVCKATYAIGTQTLYFNV